MCKCPGALPRLPSTSAVSELGFQVPRGLASALCGSYVLGGLDSTLCGSYVRWEDLLPLLLSLPWVRWGGFISIV